MNTIAPDTTNAPAQEIMPAAPAFSIDSDRAADWLLRQLAALDAEAALLNAQHQAAVRRVENDRAGLMYQFGAQLEDFARRSVQADLRRRKSLILPHGTLAFRAVPASVRVTDPAAAMDAARAFSMPDMVRTVETLDTARYQKAAQQALQTQGCLLPGVEATPAREAFSIRFGGKGEPE